MDLPPSPSQVRLFRQELLGWFGENERGFPWRDTRDPWPLLVAEVLLRHTFARKVVPVYEEFLRRWPTPTALAMADEPEVRGVIQPLGLINRAGELLEIAGDVRSRFGGRVPTARADLLTLRGVGDYTASAVLTFALGEREPIVDTNVLRLFKRTFGLGTPLRQLQPTSDCRRLARCLLPRDEPRRLNLALLDFTAQVCTHYQPKCLGCPLLSLCRTPGAL